MPLIINIYIYTTTNRAEIGGRLVYTSIYYSNTTREGKRVGTRGEGEERGEHEGESGGKEGGEEGGGPGGKKRKEGEV